MLCSPNSNVLSPHHDGDAVSVPKPMASSLATASMAKKNKEDPDLSVDGGSHYNMSGGETLHGHYAVVGILGQGSVLDGPARRRFLSASIYSVALIFRKGLGGL